MARDGLIELARRERLPIETLCPYEEVKTRKPGRDGSYRLVTEALAYFPGYIFAETDEIALVESVNGVVRVLDNAEGRPFEVPYRDIEILKESTKEGGKMSFVDYTKPSLRFKGFAGDGCQLKDCGLAGFPGEIVSRDRLDSDEEITVRVKVFGAEREINVSYLKVGHILPRVPNGRMSLLGA